MFGKLTKKGQSQHESFINVGFGRVDVILFSCSKEEKKSNLFGDKK